MFKRLLTAVGVAALLTYCKAPEHPVAEQPRVTSTEPQEGGRLVRRLAAAPASLNPVLESTGYERDVVGYVFDGLVEIDKDLKVIPSLAKSWEISPDARNFTFHLDPAANFADGSPVRAADVVFTLSKIVDPKSESMQLAGLFQDIDLTSTQALDDHTVRVQFKEARPARLYSFSIAILPQHFYESGDFKRAFSRKAMGAGPYVVKEYRPGQSIRLVRRENYWREKPAIREILFKVIADDRVAWNALLAGEIDETRVNSDRWKREKDNHALSGKVRFERFYLLGYNFIPWNTRDAVLRDARVRRALAMCFDRRSMIQSLFYGTARVISGPFTPDQWAYNPQVKPIEFNTAAARKLLEESGWRDGNNDGKLERDGKPLEIELLLPAGNATSAVQGQIFQQAAAAAGFAIKLTTVDPAAMFERIFAGKYQGAFLQWDLDIDPDVYSLFHSSQMPPAGQNFVFFSDAAIDALIDRGRKELNEEEREKIYHEIHTALADQQPYLWTVQVSEKWAFRERVQGVEQSNGLGLFHWYPGARQWWLAAAGEPRPNTR